MRYFLIFISSVVIFGGCEFKTPPLSEVLGYEQKALILPKTSQVSTYEMEDYQTTFLQKLFSPWDKQTLWGSIKDVSWGFDLFKGNKKYVGESRVEIDDLWLENIKNSTNIEHYGSILSYAITTKRTNLRIFPTDKPLFKVDNENFDYPFDSLQTSSINIMQPLLISHYSKDMAWAFVQSAFASGWIKSNEIALVDKNMMYDIRNSPKIVITKDNTPTYYEQGIFAQYLKVGEILPILSQEDNLYRALVVKTTDNGNGIYANVTVENKFANLFPLELNSTNTQQITEELLNENYGWGGLYSNRDCSALTRDFLTTFGVWLPRNSRAQRDAGMYFDVSNLKQKEKEDKLKEFGVPYLTLVYLPGHIMLYIGDAGGKAIVLHNIWGIKTKDNGRYVIGKSVISDLYLGEKVKSINTQSLPINKMVGFTILAPKEAQKKAKLFMAYKDHISSIKNDIIYFKDGSQLIYDDKKDKTYEQRYENPDIKDQIFEIYKKGKLNNDPQNDAGRIRNEEFFKTVYGSSKEEIEKNLIKVTWLPSSANITLLFNKNNNAAKALQAVSDELDKLPDRYLEFMDNPSGTYNYRTISNTNKLSMHAFGIAIDLNTDKSNYWLWDNDTKIYNNFFPQTIIDVFEKHKFIWGGKWKHYDTMHFEYRPEFF